MQILTKGKVFQRGCCLISFETNRKSLNLTEVQEKNYCRLLYQNTALSHTNCSNVFLFCSNPDVTTNALKAETPTELVMAEASDTPQVGIDTLHFQILTNRISGGSLDHWKLLVSPSRIYCIKESLLQATDSPERGKS